MNESNIIKRMKSFIKRYKGKETKFSDLSSYDKFNYVLVDTYCYFGNLNFLKHNEILNRAVGNAKAHKKSNYEFFKNKIIKVV